MPEHQKDEKKTKKQSDPQDERDKEHEEKERQVKEVMRLLESLENEKGKGPRDPKVTLVLGFLLHEKKWVHMALSLVIHVIAFIAVLGLFYESIIYNHIATLGLMIVLFTVFESALKFLMLKFGKRVVVYSLGLVFYIGQGMVFFLLHLVFETIFRFASVDGFFIFVTAFALLRLFLSVYMRKFRFRRGIRRHLKG